MKAALPGKISKDGPFAMMGVTNSTYLDLEVYLNQVMDVIAAIQEEG